MKNQTTGDLRNLVLGALGAVDDARRKCLAAGQALNEARVKFCQERDGGNGRFLEGNSKGKICKNPNVSPFRHDAGTVEVTHSDRAGFEAFLARIVPEIHVDTARRWMRAAGNVARALPPAPGAIDVEAEVVAPSEILVTPDDELGEEAREWKQGWLDFTADKTIRECLEGVFVDGDDEHRVDRAINGKMKGGAGGDRKDFPFYVARHLADMGQHLSHWDGMSEVQRNEARTALVAAIQGDRMRLPGRPAQFNFRAWPLEFCAVAVEALREILRGAK